MSARPLKAYSVLEHDERTGDIYFARHAIVAARAGANEFGDGELCAVECRRAPWADQYAPGPVPWKARIEQGWHIECSACGQDISDDAYDDDGEPISFDIVEDRSGVFCRPTCQEQFVAERAEVKRIKAHVMRTLTDALLKQMPGAIVIDPYDLERTYVYVPFGQWPLYPQAASVSFVFPGSRHGTVKFEFKMGGRDRRTVCLVPAGDLGEFLRWKRAGYPPAMMDAAVE